MRPHSKPKKKYTKPARGPSLEPAAEATPASSPPARVEVLPPTTAAPTYLDKMINQVAIETDQHVVELARRLGPSVLKFLQNVMLDNYVELGFEKPLNSQSRLAAADLIRKFSALPTNIDLGLKAPPTVVYTGVPSKTPRLPAEITRSDELTTAVLTSAQIVAEEEANDEVPTLEELENEDEDALE